MMVKLKIQVIASLLGLSLLASCDPTFDTVDMGYDYFPTDLNRYYIYEVDSIYIDCTAGVNDTFHYQIKEYYDTTFTDASNNLAIRLERSYRPDSLQPWLIWDIWWLSSNQTRMEKIEENNPFVKMIYPVTQGESWDGNAFNFMPSQTYFYGSQDIPHTLDGHNYDSTVTVHQLIDTNLIEHYYFTETFRRNVGMVTKVEINVESSILNDSNNPGTGNTCYQYINPPLFWYQVYILKRIKKGWIVKYKLIEYGYE